MGESDRRMPVGLLVPHAGRRVAALDLVRSLPVQAGERISLVDDGARRVAGGRGQVSPRLGDKAEIELPFLMVFPERGLASVEQLSASDMRFMLVSAL